ncbi:ankyrin repeat domain-containing protein 26-like [Ursus arctos]|uniref:ankyrin repeat domain-containing protein 26-like n=1 Tax=Ursus arctos TaxID=9644 RepID=UPI002547C7BB|nr:ankyrin repeat domain-containing protein 26-like [Ursus arctos]
MAGPARGWSVGRKASAAEAVAAVAAAVAAAGARPSLVLPGPDPGPCSGRAPAEGAAPPAERKPAMTDFKLGIVPLGLVAGKEGEVLSAIGEKDNGIDMESAPREQTVNDSLTSADRASKNNGDAVDESSEDTLSRLSVCRGADDARPTSDDDFNIKNVPKPSLRKLMAACEKFKNLETKRGLITVGDKLSLTDDNSDHEDENTKVHDLFCPEIPSPNTLKKPLRPLEGLGVTKCDDERGEMKKFIELKQPLEYCLDQEMKKSGQLEKEITRLKKLLSMTRSEVDDLTAKLETASSKCLQLDEKNQVLSQKLLSMKELQKKCEKLEKDKKKLEQQVVNLKSHAEVNMAEYSRIEQYKRELDKRARLDMEEKLREVNLFLQVNLLICNML